MSQSQNQGNPTGATGPGNTGAPTADSHDVNVEVNEAGAPGNQPAAPAPTPNPGATGSMPPQPRNPQR